MTQLHLRIVFAHGRHHLTPQLHGVEHVGLVYRTETLAALARRLEADTGNTANLRLRVTHGVETFALAAVQSMNPARLAKINVPSQFADDEDVQPRNHLRLQRRRLHQLRINQRWPEIRKQVQFLAKAQDGLLRTQPTWQGIEA